jgi:murein DD-endopeptidase MepM/ murein hydrolase activator NlpD
MAPLKKEEPLRSPLLAAFNNIVNINRSGSQMRSTQGSYNDFLRFMNVEINNLESIKLPDNRQLKRISNINVAPTFGSAGSLLSSLASGALDVGGLVGDFFGGSKKNPKSAKPIQKGTKLRIPGVKGLPIISTALAGLDFAQGISQGESVGKAGAGALGSAAGAAGGALAGTALAGVIGQALIPIPGLGFVLGAGVGTLGGMAGGYLADRVYETVTGEEKAKEETQKRLKQQEQKQKIAAASLTEVTFPQVLDKFESVVIQFERSVSLGTFGPTESSDDTQAQKMDDEVLENDDYGDRDTSGSTLQGTMQDLEASGGSLPSSKLGSKYGMRFHPILRRNKMHMGNDYPMPTGTPVSVIQPGTVANAGFVNNGYGNQVKVDHPGGVSSFYAHLDSVNVQAGQQITPGTVIGKVGSTGQSTGPHLHFEVDVNGKTTDPNPYQDKIFRFGGNVKVKSSVKPQQNLTGQDVKTEGQNQQQNKSQISQQELSKMSTDQLRGMLDPTQASASNPSVFQVASNAREDGKMQGLVGDDLERKVLMATIQASQQDMPPQVDPSNLVIPVPSMQQNIPQQIQQYPDYNLPQSSVTIVPMIMGGGGGSQQRPMVISSGGSGGGTMIMPPIPEGHVLNSLFKTILLTNLSGT